MEKRPKLVILQAKKPVHLQLFFTVYTYLLVHMKSLHAKTDIRYNSKVFKS